MLDDTVRLYLLFVLHVTRISAQGNRFNSFGASLAQTSRRAGQAFGIGEGSLKTGRIVLYVILAFFGLWITSKIFSWWRPSGSV